MSVFSNLWHSILSEFVLLYKAAFFYPKKDFVKSLTKVTDYMLSENT